MAIALQSLTPPKTVPAVPATIGGRWVVPLILAQVLSTLAIIPISGLPGPELPTLTPFFLSGVLTAELATSFLLFAWFHDIRTWPLFLLATAYLYSTALLSVYLLTFPSAVLPDRVFVGGSQAAAWVFMVWTNGFAGLTLAAATLEWRGGNRRMTPEQARVATKQAFIAVVSVAVVALAIAAAGDHLPTLVTGTSYTLLNQVLSAIGLSMLMMGIVVILLHIRRSNELFSWLAVALVGMFCADLLTALGGGRYTVGWTSARISLVISASVMFMFFVRQFVRRQHALVDMRQLLEEAVAQRTADLTETIRQRDLLLREVYHRVKNNLQVVDALIAMESRRLKDAPAREALAELRNRVFALGLVHQQLMSSNDLASFSIAPFLRELCDNVAASLALAERGVRVDVDAAPIRVNLDFAIPVGLLTTELLSNTAKRGQATEVRVSFQPDAAGQAVLAVEDNGNAELANDPPQPNTGSTGDRILEGLTRQLEGRMDVMRVNGTSVRIHLPLPDLAA
ncbi:MAG TPA: histidine kinase dimerization/phosphoacceptor domain -containing protein [Rhodopila sp.]|nr:histidine kinase dimerization/phosphoacceptor domain -containing protein [Rhodopila sp.]